jgi:hypothetical protein
VLDLVDVGEARSNKGVKFRLARRLALYIASSAASSMTLSRKCPASTTCSSLVNSFFLILSGRVKNQEASLLVMDCCLASFRRRRDVEAFRRGSITGTFRPRRSASELLRWLCIGSRTSLSAFDLELCANLNRSSVEKYCRKRRFSECHR